MIGAKSAVPLWEASFESQKNGLSLIDCIRENLHLFSEEEVGRRLRFTANLDHDGQSTIDRGIYDVSRCGELWKHLNKMRDFSLDGPGNFGANFFHQVIEAEINDFEQGIPEMLKVDTLDATLDIKAGEAVPNDLFNILARFELVKQRGI